MFIFKSIKTRKKDVFFNEAIVMKLIDNNCDKNDELMIKIKDTISKGNGVFAAKAFKIGDIALVGSIAEEATNNSVHASQIGINRFILHDEVYINTNHSCDSNCGIQVNDTGCHNLVAIKDIAEGEEITFDYAMENYTIDHFPSQCMCGSPKCRGRITGWKDLPKVTKEEFRPHAAPYLFELDAINEAKKNQEIQLTTGN